MKLFTNLSHVIIGRPAGVPRMQVRCNCSALLVQERSIVAGEGPVVRGLGPDRVWPVFDLPLESAELELRDFSGNMAMLDEEGDLQMIDTGVDIVFEGEATTLRLFAEDPTRKIRIDEFGEDDHERMWEALEGNTADFWTAPAMPFLGHGAPERVEDLRFAARQMGLASSRRI
jgi:hypothetical protein